MHPATRSRVTTLAALVVVASSMVSACDRARAPAKPDTTHTTATPAVTESITVARRSATLAWDSSAGPAMLIRTDTLPLAAVLFPELADTLLLPDTLRFNPVGVRGAMVDLYSRGGRAGQARIAKLEGLEWIGDAPTEWPAASLDPVTPASLPRWTVGLVAGRAEAIALDSIEGTTRADSAQLVAEVTRLASALGNDTAAAFRGIPYAVRSAYRFTAAPGVHAVAAELVRHVPQEASPAVEHIFIVAERDSGVTTGRYHAAYFDRSSGPEESTESTDVLAAITIGLPRRAALVLERVGYESAAYTLLERIAKTWKVRWT
ncbi:MAG: hypothetical protein ABJD07_16395, partial [Gemmatimonadaceae bacterium]